ISATNADLRTPVRPLRHDLYHRLTTVILEIPPLRERPEDLRLLVENFLARFAATEGLPHKALSDDAWMAIGEYAWPGNVRELRKAGERALVLSGDVIERADLLSRKASPPPRATPKPDRRLEASQLREAIVAHGSRAAAARALGMAPSTLYR